MKRTKSNSIPFEEYLNELLEEKGEKAYIAAIIAATQAKEGPKHLPQEYWGGYRLSDE